ncbi:hypothetical protein TNCV_812161 [Trichonephila clavipes]|nr:hypothetical protein TNCV_812161 [Trichonephila clavipes]
MLVSCHLCDVITWWEQKLSALKIVVLSGRSRIAVLGITGDAARRRQAIRERERSAVETEERNKRLAAMAQRDQERRAEETEKQRSHRLAAMTLYVYEKRAEETEEQRNHRLSTMGQHARGRRLNASEEQN